MSIFNEKAVLRLGRGLERQQRTERRNPRKRSAYHVTSLKFLRHACVTTLPQGLGRCVLGFEILSREGGRVDQGRRMTRARVWNAMVAITEI